MRIISTLFLLLFFTLFTCSLMGQSRVIDSNSTEARRILSDFRSGLDLRMEMDTIQNPIGLDTCSNTVSRFGITDNWGTVSGMNAFGDLSKAQLVVTEKFSSFTVQALGLFFTINNLPDSTDVTIKIYGEASEGGPGEELGAQVIKKEFIMTSDDGVPITSVVFENPPLVEGNRFYVAVDFEGLYDGQSNELALFNTRQGCGDGSTAWEKWSDGSWNDYVSVWELNAELPTIVIITETQSTSAEDINENISETFVSPNPAIDRTVLNYTMTESDQVNLAIRDISGKEISNLRLGSKTSGKHSQTISTLGWNAGIYIYTLRIGNKISSGKFTVIK